MLTKRFWIHNFYWMFLLVFVILFFGRIAYNGAAYSEYKKKFTVACEKAEGVVVYYGGRRGWPMLECRNPNSIIYVDVENS